MRHHGSYWREWNKEYAHTRFSVDLLSSLFKINIGKSWCMQTATTVVALKFSPFLGRTYCFTFSWDSVSGGSSGWFLHMSFRCIFFLLTPTLLLRIQPFALYNGDVKKWVDNWFRTEVGIKFAFNKWQSHKINDVRLAENLVSYIFAGIEVLPLLFTLNFCMPSFWCYDTCTCYIVQFLCK